MGAEMIAYTIEYDGKLYDDLDYQKYEQAQEFANERLEVGDEYYVVQIEVDDDGNYKVLEKWLEEIEEPIDDFAEHPVWTKIGTGCK